jgi:hypothetical protein
MIKHIIENISEYGPLEWSIVASIIVVLILLS